MGTSGKASDENFLEMTIILSFGSLDSILPICSNQLNKLSSRGVYLISCYFTVDWIISIFRDTIWPLCPLKMYTITHTSTLIYQGSFCVCAQPMSRRRYTCNVVSQWLGAYTKWSLVYYIFFNAINALEWYLSLVLISQMVQMAAINALG